MNNEVSILKRYAIAITTAVMGLLSGIALYQLIDVEIKPHVVQAQRGDTIFNVLLTNGSTTGIFTPLVQNIGQSQHRALIQYSNAPTKTCTAQDYVDFAFMGSIDNVTFYEFGSPGTFSSANNNGNIETVFEGDGAYPYVKIAVNSFDTVNCRITVQYTGVLYPNPASVAIIPNYQNRGFRNIGFTHTFTGGDNFTIKTNPSTNRFFILYALEMSSTAATNISFVNSGGGSFAVFPTGGGSFFWGGGGVPYKDFNRGGNLGADVAINSSAAATVSGFITLRLEDNP